MSDDIDPSTWADETNIPDLTEARNDPSSSNQSIRLSICVADPPNSITNDETEVVPTSSGISPCKRIKLQEDSNSEALADDNPLSSDDKTAFCSTNQSENDLDSQSANSNLFVQSDSHYLKDQSLCSSAIQSEMDSTRNQSACSLITHLDYTSTDRSRDSGLEPSNGSCLQLCSTPKATGIRD